MSPLDRKLASVFKALDKGARDKSKKHKACKEFAAIRGKIVDGALGKKVEFLFDAFSRPPTDRQKLEVKEALDTVRDVRERRFLETSALLFTSSLVGIEGLGWRVDSQGQPAVGIWLGSSQDDADSRDADVSELEG